jgi:predicted Zn-dependent peptidase
MDLIKIIDKHTETALKEAEEIKQISETMRGFALMQNDKVKKMLDDTSSLLYQVARSIEDSDRGDDGDEPSKIVPFDPTKR